MTDVKTIHITVDGTVQGVGFRYFVQQQAIALKLTGWVRNKHDEKVEILAQGEEIQLQHLLALVRVGPSMAHVTDLEIEWSSPVVAFTRFSIASTE